MKISRLSVLAPLALLGASVVLPTGVANASPKDDGGGLRLLVPTLAPLLAGQEGWVSALWAAEDDVCDVSVTASGPGVAITYPTNTASFSSFSKQASLEQGATDFTALRIAVAPSTTSAVPVTLTATYTELSRGKSKKDDESEKGDKAKKGDGNGKCNGPQRSTKVTTRLPIAKPSGPEVVHKTTTVKADRTAPVWANLDYETSYPGLDDFRVTLRAPKGLSVLYPGEKPNAGLAASGTLPVGKPDRVSVRLDASGLEPGSYEVPVTATWRGGSSTSAVTVTVR